ncbi:MAG: hypothetical protein JNL60_14750, partial [Bacteroidia bacterium]|nr:hypothetical protein [Bacteroidia bacterium]
MIKSFFIIINSVVLFIFGLITGDGGITVTHNIPANIVAGQDVAIEMKIDKGSMGGFAKFQIELPDGITIKESEDKGANYSYNEGIAKWVWAALPTESEIVIKLTIVASEAVSGLKTIGAKYSYVENNVKQVVEMTPAEFTVHPPGTDITNLANVTPPQTPDTSAKNTASLANTAGNDTNGIVSVKRSITAGGADNEFLITLNIKKGNTKGFARYSDLIPDNVIVKSAKTDGGSFSVSDGKLKFVWVNVPEKEELEISYTISGTNADPVMLGGEYSYLEDNQSKKYKVPLETIAFQTNQYAAKKAEETKESEKTNLPETKTSDPETANPATVKSVEESVAKKLAESINETMTENKKQGTLNYMVQVGAFTNAKVTAQRMKQKFKINQKIKSEMADGYTKFMIGSHGDYRSAHDQRET